MGAFFMWVGAGGDGDMQTAANLHAWLPGRPLHVAYIRASIQVSDTCQLFPKGPKKNSPLISSSTTITTPFPTWRAHPMHTYMHTCLCA